jgi:two-component system sensor histidine kinase HydH
MAALAAIALGVTLFVAQRALTQASDIVVRGEADALIASVVADLAQQGGAPPTTELFQQEIETYKDRGLRYVAVLERDHKIEAGTATMPDVHLHPGESSTLGSRVRAAGLLPPIHFFDPSAPPPNGPPNGPPKGPRPHFGPGLIVVELEPPLIHQLRGDLLRIGIVGAGAVVVLVGFAVALTRNANRLAAIEQRAAREQRLVALGSMSSVMAHELRNPLASLKGHAQLLAEDLDDGAHDAQKKKADRVVDDAQRLEDLTTSLLDFVRDGPIERTEIAARTLVTTALEDLPSDRVDVMIENVEGVVVDAPRLARAVHNLVDNALKASPDDARIELSVERRDGDIVICVRDHGPGIDDAAQIFEPFVTTRVRGTGLGLPVARRIAEQHGGTIVAENHPSGGAVFTLRFPAVSA